MTKLDLHEIANRRGFGSGRKALESAEPDGPMRSFVVSYTATCVVTARSEAHAQTFGRAHTEKLEWDIRDFEVKERRE